MKGTHKLMGGSVCPTSKRGSSSSLLVVAVYKPYDVATQLLYPWLFFYGFVGIPALVTASILLAVNLGTKSTNENSHFLSVATGKPLYYPSPKQTSHSLPPVCREWRRPEGDRNRPAPRGGRRVRPHVRPRHSPFPIGDQEEAPDGDGPAQQG